MLLVLLAFLLLLGVLVVAKRLGFFKLPMAPTLFVTLPQALGAFSLYFLVIFLLLPLALVLLTLLRGEPLSGLTDLSKEKQSWLSVGGLGSLFILTLFYLRFLPPSIRRGLFWEPAVKRSASFFKGMKWGSVGWLVSYPAVIFTSLFTEKLSLLIWHEKTGEQVAVKQLKLTLEQPGLFVAMALTVSFLIPIIEEILFRGFLQNVLKRYLSRRNALLSSAFLFAMAHFAPSQGIANFQLIATLFALALFLGFIYERAQTLWAPITLHVLFNSVSVWMIFIEK